MAPLTRIVLMLFLIIIGISLSSNNYIHQFVVSTFYHHQALAGKLLRPIGIIIALSSVLLITEYAEIGLLINILLAMFLFFCYLRSRSVLHKHQLSAREKAIQEYQAEIKAKRQHIEQLKLDIAKKNKQKELEKQKDWNNNSLTTKEIIDGLNDKNDEA